MLLQTMRRTFPLFKRVMELELTEWEERVFRFLRRVSVVTSGSEAVELRVAGGWVRDKLLKRDSGDIDIAVRHASGYQFASRVYQFAAEKGSDPSISEPDLDAAQIIGCPEYVPDMSPVTKIPANPSMSRHLETATVRMDGHDLDFVQLRTEDYVLNSCNRIPLTVAAGTPQEDASRRDFTVNALFYNLQTGTVEDFTDSGLQDLRDGVLRTPLDPKVTLLEDPLRALRAIRFACRLDFDLHPDLSEALSGKEVHESLLRKVSRERIACEITGILESEHPVRGLKMIFEHDLVEPVFLQSFSPTHDSRDNAYSIGLKRTQIGLDILQTAKDIVGPEAVTLSRKNLILATFIWDASRVRPSMHKALRLQKRLQSDVRRVILLSIRLEHSVRKWYSFRDDESLQEAENMAWIEMAETVREAGEQLWIPVCIVCGIRMGNDRTLHELDDSGISADICKVKYAVSGRRLQEELGIRPGPEVGKALRDLLVLQLLHYRQSAIVDNETGNARHSIPSPDVCVQLLKESRLSANSGSGA